MMRYLRRPSYYRRFSCIASACTDTCCAGWEIDVDDETLEKYRQVQGPFAERLRREIVLPEDPESGEPAHFKLKEHDRCPFLNGQNLCDIYLELGRDALSYICTHHPRFYEWYPDGQEAGLGLVCEAAAELILEETGVPEFEELREEDSDEETDSADEADLSVDRLLFEARDRMFRMIKSGESQEIIADRLYACAQETRAEYDRLLFGDEEETKKPEAFRFSDVFWSEAFLSELLSIYRGLEVNDLSWWELLGRIREELPVLLKQRAAFRAYYRDRLYEYEQLLIYFLYRYFMKSRMDGEVTERVVFALLSVGMIELAGLACWVETGQLTHRKQIDICKQYAREIEYDEENVDRLSHIPVGQLSAKSLPQSRIFSSSATVSSD